MNKRHFSIFVLAVGFIIASCSNGESAMSIPVILDTDTGNDIDDVLAIEMLFNYEDKGIIDLKGISLSKSNPSTISFVDAYCRMHGREDIPLGYAYSGVNPEKSLYTQPALDTLISGNKILVPHRDITSHIPEGFKMLRKVLSEADDNSVVFIAVGPETNLARLIESPGDEITSLSGKELVSRKVKLLSVMGGLYEQGYEFPEWNIEQDIASARTVFSEWPSEIVASGWELGNRILYPHESIENDFEERHPLRVAYGLFGKMPYDRPTWDLTSVLYAIEPDADHFELSPSGRIEIDSEGYSNFIPDENGRHRFLSIADEERVKSVQNKLEQQVSGKFK